MSSQAFRLARRLVRRAKRNAQAKTLLDQWAEYLLGETEHERLRNEGENETEVKD